MRTIGNKLLAVRKKMGLTRADVAEMAELSDRAYADIERGCVNMRNETVLKICEALHITPYEIFAEKTTLECKQNELFERLSMCPPKERETALSILEIYLQSIV